MPVRVCRGDAVQVMVAMSGGVDSSVAAALLVEAGHDVTGITLRLWGGPSDSGCCSVGDVEDARRVAAQLGVPHYVFDEADEFEAHVVEPYAAAHAVGATPNPCVACNRHLKFGRLLDRARALGVDALATGHHARVRRGDDGVVRLLRAVDAAKDQSYVLVGLTQDRLASVRFPVGDLTKAEVRARAAALGLRTADKPESMDVCFVARADRVAFVEARVGVEHGAPAAVRAHAGQHRRKGEARLDPVAFSGGEEVALEGERDVPSGEVARLVAARHGGEADAPDIDGRVYIRGKLPIGEFAKVRIIGHTDYDLIGEPC